MVLKLPDLSKFYRLASPGGHARWWILGRGQIWKLSNKVDLHTLLHWILTVGSISHYMYWGRNTLKQKCRWSWDSTLSRQIKRFVIQASKWTKSVGAEKRSRVHNRLCGRGFGGHLRSPLGSKGRAPGGEPGSGAPRSCYCFKTSY